MTNSELKAAAVAYLEAGQHIRFLLGQPLEYRMTVEQGATYRALMEPYRAAVVRAEIPESGRFE